MFLDEVGEMPLSVQAKLLRVLEQREVVRVGSVKPRPIDVRILAATNRDLESEVARGRFRQDFYFRLNKFMFHIPPLRERVDEIEPLARLFIHQACHAMGRECDLRLGSEALAILVRYEWPGNIRELKNVIERAYILADDQIEASHIPTDVGVPEVELPEQSAAPPLKVGTSLADAERRLIMATLTHFAGDKRRAAETLGISLKTLYNRLNSYRGAA